MNKGDICPFELDEIVVFESYFRFEIYISRIMQVHIDYFGNGAIPKIRTATLEEKKSWYDCGDRELVIDRIRL